MLAVVDDAQAVAGDGHAAWSELFNEMFMPWRDSGAPNTVPTGHGNTPGSLSLEL
jgi:hypothetical protein